MTEIIVGDPGTAAELDQSDSECGRHRFWPEGGEPPSEPGSSATLAWALAAFEAEVKTREVDSVLLCDDSEIALAAALVATKWLIPVAATAAARRSSSANGRLIDQLADAYTRIA